MNGEAGYYFARQLYDALKAGEQIYKRTPVCVAGENATLRDLTVAAARQSDGGAASPAGAPIIRHNQHTIAAFGFDFPSSPRPKGD